VPHIKYSASNKLDSAHPSSEKYSYFIVSNHPHWWVHTNMDEPVWFNPLDAQKLGVTHGDIVKVTFKIQSTKYTTLFQGPVKVIYSPDTARSAK